MILPDGVTFHYGGKKYGPGDEVPKQLEQFLPESLKKTPAVNQPTSQRPAPRME